MIGETLYKRTSSGKVQTWAVEIDGDKYRAITGLIDGKKITNAWTIAKPKNVGKSNETSADEQAALQVEAMYTKQLKSDYHIDIDDIDNETRFNPMLAEKWKDRKNKIADQFVSMQPKLDGIRCLVTNDGTFSREGELFVTVNHIHRHFKNIFDAYPNLVIDGELYNHDYKDDFNKISSLVKKTKPTQEDLIESEAKVQYWVYDVYLPGHFTKRHSSLKNMIKECGPIVLVDTIYGAHIDNVDIIASSYIEQGFEGAMVRLEGYEYEKKRSKSLLKWKEFQDDEFVIVDIRDGEGNRSDVAARVDLLTHDGKEFSAGVIGNMVYCRDLYVNKNLYIGKKGTVVFQNYTPDGIPRFGKFKCVRDYE